MTDKQILEQAGAVAAAVTAHRRHIHADPELSFAEERTANYIESILDSHGISHRRIAGTGVLAKIEGSGDLISAVVLRADTDALPVEEANADEFASRNRGVMHACGHDMHTAVLLGALKVLNDNRQHIEGTLFGLFQPGEEVWPGGASLVLEEDPFRYHNVKAVVGQHVDPEMPTGTFGFRPGMYMASTDELHMTLHGQGGHGAMPQNLRDPVVAAAAVVMSLQQVVSRNADPRMPGVLSIGRIIADGATNVVPDKVYMEGTFRTFDETWRAAAKQRIREIAISTSAAYDVTAEVDIKDGYPCVVNDNHLTAKAMELTGALVGEDSVVALDLRTTAEDFGYYTRLYPSLFYRFGVGYNETAKAGRLHTPVFHPDESAMRLAVAVMVNLALNL